MTHPTSPDAAYLNHIASMMAEMAPHLCRDDCYAYHRAWGYLRLFGALPAVGRDHDTLLTHLRGFARSGSRRVLISGSADAGILAYVQAAFALEALPCAVTVIDRCATPLAVNQWYGIQHGLCVETWCGLAQDYKGRGYDLVVSHNFLGSIPEPDRQSVIQMWHDALRPGGTVFAVTSIKSGESPSGRRFDEAQVETLVADVEQGRNQGSSANSLPPDALAELVRAYAETRVSHRLTSDGAVLNPVKAAGLRVISFERTDLSLKGSAAIARKTRKCLVAERPA